MDASPPSAPSGQGDTLRKSPFAPGSAKYDPMVYQMMHFMEGQRQIMEENNKLVATTVAMVGTLSEETVAMRAELASMRKQGGHTTSAAGGIGSSNTVSTEQLLPWVTNPRIVQGAMTGSLTPKDLCALVNPWLAGNFLHKMTEASASESAVVIWRATSSLKVNEPDPYALLFGKTFHRNVPAFDSAWQLYGQCIANGGSFPATVVWSAFHAHWIILRKLAKRHSLDKVYAYHAHVQVKRLQNEFNPAVWHDIDMEGLTLYLPKAAVDHEVLATCDKFNRGQCEAECPESRMHICLDCRGNHSRWTSACQAAIPEESVKMEENNVDE